MEYCVPVMMNIFSFFVNDCFSPFLVSFLRFVPSSRFLDGIDIQARFGSLEFPSRKLGRNGLSNAYLLIV